MTTGTQWHTVGSQEFEEFCEKMQNKFLKNIIQIKNGEEPNETKEDDKDDNIEGAQKLGKNAKTVTYKEIKSLFMSGYYAWQNVFLQ